MKTGIELIQEERTEQIEHHRFTPEQDKQYKNGELAVAAICYAIHDHFGADDIIEWLYPWSKATFKPKDRIKNLQKAGALIAAEIDRLNNEQLQK